MSDLVAPQHRSPIPGWTIAGDGLVAVTRWHYSWPIFYVLAAIWNLGLPHVHFDKSPPEYLAWVGEIVAAIFTLLALRAFFARTVIRFSAKELTVENALAPWQRYRVDLAEIAGFEVVEHPQTGHADVGARVTSGVVEALPIDWQPLTVSMNHTRKRIAVAPVEDASWLAGALTDMLGKARLLGHDRYRS